MQTTTIQSPPDGLDKIKSSPTSLRYARQKGSKESQIPFYAAVLLFKIPYLGNKCIVQEL